MTRTQCHMQDSDVSDSESDRSGSVADSAFIYKAQASQKFGGSLGGPDFDRMSQRLEKDLGLGNDMESLLSMERGGSQVDSSAGIHPLHCPPVTLSTLAMYSLQQEVTSAVGQIIK